MPTQMRERSQKELDALPNSVFAVVDGKDRSYPIEDEADLKDAIQAFGRAKNKAAAKAGIIRRARALNGLKLLPEDWDVPDGNDDADDKKASEVVQRATRKAFSLPTGMTYQDVYRAIQNELQEDFGNPSEYGPGLWLSDFDDAFCYYDDGQGQIVRRPYTITGDRDVQFGAPEEVEQRTTYTPVAGNEPHAFASKRHSASDQDHLDKAAEHMAKAGANFPPSPEVMADQQRELSEAFSVQMTDDPHLHSMPFTLPQWFGEADDLPEWVPYLPVPHDFAHPSYGTVSITPERIANFVTQFNAGIYQDQIPLDGEHRTKESGALAWVKELRTNEDGSADARVKWTPRGEQMYRDGAFNYISPEWYDEWSDPATGAVYQDVAIGGALTTRPFFKAPYLRPLAASEDAGGDSRNQPHAGERSQGMTAATEQVTPAQFTELESKFTELMGKHSDLEEKFSEVVTERDQLKEVNDQREARIAKLEADARTKRFSELVSGWVGTPERNRTRLEKVAERFGEDSEEFKDEVTQGRAFAEQVKMAEKVGGSIFKELGSSQAADTDSKSGRLHAMAEERAEKKGITYEKAYSEILEEKPELYEG